MYEFVCVCVLLMYSKNHKVKYVGLHAWTTHKINEPIHYKEKKTANVIYKKKNKNTYATKQHVELDVNRTCLIRKNPSIGSRHYNYFLFILTF